MQTVFLEPRHIQLRTDVFVSTGDASCLEFRPSRPLAAAAATTSSMSNISLYSNYMLLKFETGDDPRRTHTRVQGVDEGVAILASVKCEGL